MAAHRSLSLFLDAHRGLDPTCFSAPGTAAACRGITVGAPLGGYPGVSPPAEANTHRGTRADSLTGYSHRLKQSASPFIRHSGRSRLSRENERRAAGRTPSLFLCLARILHSRPLDSPSSYPIPFSHGHRCVDTDRAINVARRIFSGKLNFYSELLATNSMIGTALYSAKERLEESVNRVSYERPPSSECIGLHQCNSCACTHTRTYRYITRDRLIFARSIKY